VPVAGAAFSIAVNCLASDALRGCSAALQGQTVRHPKTRRLWSEPPRFTQSQNRMRGVKNGAGRRSRLPKLPSRASTTRVAIGVVKPL
jgi:hypothetical protein